MPYDEVHEYGKCKVSIKKNRNERKVVIDRFPKTHMKELLKVIEKADTARKKKTVKPHPYTIVRGLIDRTYDYNDRRKYTRCYKWSWWYSEYLFKKIRRELNKAGYKDIEIKMMNGYFCFYLPYKYLEDGRLPLYAWKF